MNGRLKCRIGTGQIGAWVGLRRWHLPYCEIMRFELNRFMALFDSQEQFHT